MCTRKEVVVPFHEHYDLLNADLLAGWYTEITHIFTGPRMSSSHRKNL